MRIEFTPAALKQLEGLKRLSGLSLRFRLAFEQISVNPYIGKALSGEFEGAFSYRVGDYRIIYQVVEDQLLVLIIRVGHRKEVYK
jgi:mRNA interferase RelE/StbE